MSRIEIMKTYKLFIGGAFPRSESGRHFSVSNATGVKTANCCQASRKDVKAAVVAAQKALGLWSEKTAFNRSQILYRVAEMLEGRKHQFSNELELIGKPKAKAMQEIEEAIDRLIYYAGWCDKYVQVSSSVNAVSSPHFNFSVPEPQGVIGGVLQQATFLDLVTILASVIAGGNTLLILATKELSAIAISFAEVIATSDVPGGVVNILTGDADELLDVFSTHKGINGLVLLNANEDYLKNVDEKSVSNLKRITHWKSSDLNVSGPSLILQFQELKTTWHPIENIGGASSTY